MNLTTKTIDRRQFLSASALLLATPAIGALAGCGAAPAQSGQANGSSFNGQFIVGFDQDFPPYGYVGDDGQFTGFDLDLAKAVCELEGWTFSPKPIAWDAKDGLLNSGQITCIWNGFTIESRENDYAFTSAYMENRQVVVVKADSAIKTPADLAGKNVITQADSTAYHLLSKGGDKESLGSSFSQLQTIGEYNTAFMMLESGAVDAIAADYPVATFNIGDKKSSYRILDESLSSEHYGVGFAKGDAGSELAKKVEADLKKLDEQGKVREICQKYQDKGVSYDLWVLPKA
jgi:polar amino acid transport system substrate-binding protein